MVHLGVLNREGSRHIVETTVNTLVFGTLSFIQLFLLQSFSRVTSLSKNYKSFIKENTLQCLRIFDVKLFLTSRLPLKVLRHICGDVCILISARLFCSRCGGPGPPLSEAFPRCIIGTFLTQDCTPGHGRLYPILFRNLLLDL